MTGKNRISLADIVGDSCGWRLRLELRSNWAIAVLARWPSVPLTWIAARLGVRPMAVSILGFALSLSLPVQGLILPVTGAAWTIAFVGLLIQVLDCVDGTLARLTGQTSTRGADVDFLVDMTYWGLLYLSIGILADQYFGTDWGWTALAAMAGWARLMARVVRDRLDSGAAGEPAPLRMFDYPVVFLAGLSGIIPLFALGGQWLGAAVVFLLVYSLLDIIEGALPLIRRP